MAVVEFYFEADSLDDATALVAGQLDAAFGGSGIEWDVRDVSADPREPDE